MASIESEISAMQSRISAIRAENNQIQSEINMMVNAMQNAVQGVQSAGNTTVNTLHNGETTLVKDDGTLHGVERVEADIREKVALYKNMENAYKNIRQLNNRLRYEQGNEKTVRRVITAMIDNEQKALVSEETIVSQAEKLYLNTQFYFLSHIMMDLQLRKRGETTAADRAQASALKMNARKTAWVYFMVALRRGDEKEAIKWFDKIADRPLHGDEKDLMKVLALISFREKGVIGEKVRKYIHADKLAEIDRDSIVSSILATYRSSMQIKPPTFKYIEANIAEKQSLNNALYGAMNNESVGAYVQNVAAGEDARMRDDVLSGLFEIVVGTCHSPNAQKINEEIARNQRVIDARGNLQEAESLNQSARIEEASDIQLEDCLYEWLTEKDRYNGKKEVNEFAYSHLKPSYKRAYKNYLADYRRNIPKQLTVTVGDFTWKTEFKNPEDEEKKIRAHCEERCKQAKAKIKDTSFILLLIFGGLLLVAGIVFCFLKSVVGDPYHIVIAVIGCVLGCGLLISATAVKYKHYRAKIFEDERCAKDIIGYNEEMRYVFNDIQSFRAMYKENDEKALPESFFDL